MKFLVISDTHGETGRIRLIMSKYKNEIAFCLHLGDSEGGDSEIRSIVGDLKIVRGNCDFFTDAEDHLLVKIGRYNCLLTHGHLLGAKKNMEGLLRAAKEVGADYVFYGHTHRAMIQTEDGITLVNPGSLGYPRGGNPSFIIGEVNNEGEIKLSLEYIA